MGQGSGGSRVVGPGAATPARRKSSYNWDGLRMMFDLRSVSSIRGAARWTRHRFTPLIALLVCFAIFFAACFWQKENIEGTFENRTDSVLCAHYDYADNAYAGGCPRELKPHTSADWFFECGDALGADKFPITVILTVKEGGIKSTRGRKNAGCGRNRTGSS